VVIGGGNANLLTDMPPNTRMGDNANAFVGGFRLWASVESSLAPVAVRAAGERLVVDGHEACMQAAAAEFFLQALGGLESHGQFTVALSGGSTPRDLYELLASDATWRKHIPWDRTHIFWGDERHVAPDHPDSNYRMADETLLSIAPVPVSNIHRIHGEVADANRLQLTMRLSYGPFSASVNASCPASTWFFLA
jgi:hypothetical protein